jgi:hypothetical protein
MLDIAPKEQVLPTADGEYVLFRSTLESRWAMAFELLKIDWHYENRFPLPNGTYLPDFYLPEIGWIEIKPTFEELKEAEPKLQTFALHKSDLLEEELPFYSISSEHPTFRVSSKSNDSMLIEWLPSGEVCPRDRDYMIDTFRSQTKTALYQADRAQYVDFVDRAVSMAQEAHIDEPLPIDSVMTLAVRSMVKEHRGTVEASEDGEVELPPPDVESEAPF